ncbi:hypothetical protein [Dyadobacter sp. 676]|uniref:T9SS type A sorting domain-containing protein n=1 Tax=Dyadobacter sp. 676 TaxID=3088362 RepID=A0AAU8FH64_9BACT
MTKSIFFKVLLVTILSVATPRIFAQNCTINAGTDKSVCTANVSLNDANRNGSFTANPVWTVVSQPAGANATFSDANALTPDVTGMNVGGTYVFRITQACGTGVATDEVTVTAYPPPNQRLPTFSACGSTSTITITGFLPAGYTGEWTTSSSEVTITPTSASAATITLNNPEQFKCGHQVSLTWTIKSPNGCTYDYFSAAFWQQSAADIELETNYTINGCGSSFTMTPLPTGCNYSNTGLISLSNIVYPAGYSGPGLTYTGLISRSVAGFTTAGTYTFRFTINLGACGTKSFDVTVTKIGGTIPPGGAVTGPASQMFCLSENPATVNATFDFTDPTLITNDSWVGWLETPSGSGTPVTSIAGSGTNTRTVTFARPASGWQAGRYRMYFEYASGGDVNGVCKNSQVYEFYFVGGTWINFDVPDVTVCTAPGSPTASYTYENVLPLELGTLTGGVTGGLYIGQWDIERISSQGPLTPFAHAYYTGFNVNGLSVGMHTFRIAPAQDENSLLYKLYQCAGSNFSDTFTVTVVANTGANAGTDQTVPCINNFALAGNNYGAPMVGTWSIVSQPPGSYSLGFTDVNDPSARITGTGDAPAGTYTFRWTMAGPPESVSCTGQFDEVTITAAAGCPLPVTLKGFRAIREGNTALLTWQTTEEVNAGHFEIQRSTDAKSWSSIGMVRAEGSSRVIRSYDYVDAKPSNGTNYYRLKMVDLDETFAFSNIQVVNVKAAALSAYPNPASNILMLSDIDPSSFSEVALVDANGKVVYKSTSFPFGGNRREEVCGRHLCGSG